MGLGNVHILHNHGRGEWQMIMLHIKLANFPMQNDYECVCVWKCEIIYGGTTKDA